MKTKYSINKKLLSQLPAQIAERVMLWQREYKKRFCYVEKTDKVFTREDAYYYAFSSDCSQVIRQQASGEFAGMTRLSPCATIPLPENHTIIEESFFMGHPYLTIFNNGGKMIE